MKRDEQMVNAAEAYAEEMGYKDDNDMCCTMNDFCAGWRAADQHPHWISVNDELPEHDEEDNGLISYPTVLVCLYDGYRTENYYDDIRGEWGDYDGEVEYWMPFPTPPAKKGGQDAR